MSNKTGAEVSAVVHQVTKCFIGAQCGWVDGKHEEDYSEVGKQVQMFNFIWSNRGWSHSHNVVNKHPSTGVVRANTPTLCTSQFKQRLV